MTYWFSVIRFVPSPVRGERVNIGVIVGSDETSEWRLQTATEANRRRCDGIDDDSNFPSLLSTLYRWQSLFDEHGSAYARGAESLPISLAWLQRMSARHRNVVQLSEPAPVDADDIDEAVDFIFESFVRSSIPESQVIEPKQHVIRVMKQSFDHVRLLNTGYLEQHKFILSGHHRQLVDFLVIYGDVLQVSQAWSFRRPNTEALIDDLKAWAYTMEKLRANGGYLKLGADDVRRIPSDVRIDVVYLPADTPKGIEAFTEASHMFVDVNAQPVPVSESDQVAGEAVDLLVASGVKRELL